MHRLNKSGREPRFEELPWFLSLMAKIPWSCFALCAARSKQKFGSGILQQAGITCHSCTSNYVNLMRHDHKAQTHHCMLYKASSGNLSYIPGTRNGSYMGRGARTTVVFHLPRLLHMTAWTDLQPTEMTCEG